MGDRNDPLRDLVERALEEDAARDDATTALLVDPRSQARASIIAKAAGIVSGHHPAATVFRMLDHSVIYNVVAADGSRVDPRDLIATVEGSCAAILSGERTALNFLQHLSGIATVTARCVAMVAGTGTVILDTRKTLPGLRALEKEAVVHGGGYNHRFDLRGRVLVKENHITAVGDISTVLERIGSERLCEVEIEVSSLEELRILRSSPPGRVMLDNFSPEQVAAAIAEIDRWQMARPEVEVSGGVNQENIARYAQRGVDCISIGALTASAPALDLSLVVSEVKPGDGQS